MVAAAAEVRGNGRGKLQRRAQEGFLERFAVGCVESGLAPRLVEEHSLVAAAAVVVFRGKDGSVGCGPPIEIPFLLHHDAESVARAWVGVEIQVPGEDFGEAHSEFRAFARIGHGVEQRIVDLPGNAGDFSFRGNRLDLGMEPAALRHNPEHPVGVDLVAHLAQFAYHRAAHGQAVPGANAPQVVNRLRGADNTGRSERLDTHALQRIAEAHPCRNLVLGIQHHLRADALGNLTREPSLARELLLRLKALIKDNAKPVRAHRGYSQHKGKKTTAHGSPGVEARRQPDEHRPPRSRWAGAQPRGGNELTHLFLWPKWNLAVKTRIYGASLRSNPPGAAPE